MRLTQQFWKAVNSEEVWNRGWGGRFDVTLSSELLEDYTRHADGSNPSLKAVIEEARRNLSPYWFSLIYRCADWTKHRPDTASDYRGYRFLGILDGQGVFHKLPRLMPLEEAKKHARKLLGVTG